MNIAIETPCISVCQLSDTDFNNPESHCLGCYRTVAEIARWGRMSPQERSIIMRGLAARKQTLAS